jgi:ferrous iron transport protein B
VVAREARSWRWAAGQFAFMSAFAYTASLIVYQTGRLLGF